jgi:hypothetical protein
MLHGQKEKLHWVEPHAAAFLQCWVKEAPITHHSVSMAMLLIIKRETILYMVDSLVSELVTS